MVKTYDLLIPSQEEEGHWSVSLALNLETPTKRAEFSETCLIVVLTWENPNLHHFSTCRV